jgi:DNA-binding NtrC family response regulator
MNTSSQRYAPAAPAAGQHESWIEGAITVDPVLAPLLPELRRLAASDACVLVSGEPGSGRELVARVIHNLSMRTEHPFLVIDCATVSEPLVEAELLGLEGPPHKPGIFEQAGEGSVLLTEVGDLPPPAQEALERILERHEIVRVNSRAPISATARCFASTSADLRARIPIGLFREALHARLATEVIVLPPLRERADDIPALARYYLSQCCGHLGSQPPELSREAEGVLRTYRWPGNVRELREVLEEAVVRSAGARIGAEHLPQGVRGNVTSAPLASLRDVEQQHIERVLHESRGNQRRASRVLGISRWSLSRRLRKYGMQPHPEPHAHG